MLDYSTYHIRMDTREPQKQFELWWAWHSISRLKSLSQENSDPKCRNNIVVFTNNNTKHLCKWRFPKKCENNIHQKVEPSVNHQHLHSLPHNGIPRPREVSPPISFSGATAHFVLRIHVRLRLEEPLDHRIAAEGSCVEQRCVASGAAARGKPPAEPNGTKGRKFWDKFWCLKSRSFWKFWPLKNPPWTSGPLWLVEKTVAFGFLAVKMSRITNQNIYSNSGAKSDPKVKSLCNYFILLLQSKLRCRQRHNPDQKNNRKSWRKCLGTLAHFP